MTEVFNAEDLLTVNVSLNTNKLFSIIKSLTDKMSQQGEYIQLLETRIREVETNQIITEQKIREIEHGPEMSNALTGAEENLRSLVNEQLLAFRTEAAEHEKKIQTLERSVKEASIDNKVRAEKNLQDIQSLQTTIRVDRERNDLKITTFQRELKDELNQVNGDLQEAKRYILVRALFNYFFTVN